MWAAFRYVRLCIENELDLGFAFNFLKLFSYLFRKFDANTINRDLWFAFISIIRILRIEIQYCRYNASHDIFPAHTIARVFRPTPINPKSTLIQWSISKLSKIIFSSISFFFFCQVNQFHWKSPLFFRTDHNFRATLCEFDRYSLYRVSIRMTIATRSNPQSNTDF